MLLFQLRVVAADRLQEGSHLARAVDAPVMKRVDNQSFSGGIQPQQEMTRKA